MTSTPPPRIAVVGPGAIGTTIAAALHEAGRTPLLAGRSPHASLRLSTPDDGETVVPGPVATDPGTVGGPVDVVFLAVKATQTARSAPWLRALVGPGTVVGVLQNGVEQVEQVRAAVDLPEGAEVVPAVVWFPAQRHPDASVTLRGEPRLTLPVGKAAERVAEALAGTRCAVELADDFTTLAWRKLLQNAVAGLMALTGRRAGQFRRADIGDLALAYLREGLAVARAAGADLPDDEPERLLGVFRAFPADMSTSILTDRESSSPLEWDVRNGVLRRRAQELGLPTPISDVLVPLLAATSDGPG